ncbi:hypothetical protein V6Z12_D08G132700 [Gossypium hirsutum]
MFRIKLVFSLSLKEELRVSQVLLRLCENKTHTELVSSPHSFNHLK